MSKVQLVESATQACSTDVAKPMATQKKAKVVVYAEAELQGKRSLSTPLPREAKAQPAA